MNEIIKHRMAIEKKLVWLMFILIGLAIIFFLFGLFVVACVSLVLWFITVIYSFVYSEHTEELVYKIS